MNEETTITPKPDTTITQTVSQSAATESAFWGVTVRGWIAFVLVDTVCAVNIYNCVFHNGVIDDTLKSMALLAIGFYFGQSKK